MKRFMLCLLVFLLALTPSMAEENMETLQAVGVSGDEFIWRFQADNGQNIYFTSREAEPFIQYQDINFDGIPDLTILTTRGASNFFSKLFINENGTYRIDCLLYILRDIASTAEFTVRPGEDQPQKMSRQTQ